MCSYGSWGSVYLSLVVRVPSREMAGSIYDMCGLIRLFLNIMFWKFIFLEAGCNKSISILISWEKGQEHERVAMENKSIPSYWRMECTDNLPTFRESTQEKEKHTVTAKLHEAHAQIPGSSSWSCRWTHGGLPQLNHRVSLPFLRHHHRGGRHQRLLHCYMSTI
jgi:hypothetical protein